MSTHRYCDGLLRRDFLQLGLGAVGFCGLRRLQAEATAASPTILPGKDVNCIMIWLDGGPSHFETFDPKPEAPADIRGPFKTVATKVPGVHFSEPVTKLAGIFEKFTVVRSICHKDPNHGGGNHYMMTGAPTPVPVGCGAYVTFHPSMGSMVSHDRGIRGGIPAYMASPSNTRSGGPNFLGGEHSPFIVSGYPNSDAFRVNDVVLPKDLSEGRLATRRELRTALDRMKRCADKAAEDPAIEFDRFYEQGFELVTSSKAQQAFDIAKEDPKVRERYGRTDMGQRFLLARRLVEAGVSWVTVNWGGWDHHSGIEAAYKGNQLQTLDQGVTALLTDLAERGLLDKTLVLVLGEFGRTPKINTNGGRDHWPGAMSVLMAGAGIPGGQIVGATDAKGYYASENVYRPEDFAASVYTKMGIDPHQMLHNSVGRPAQLVNNGRLIRELFV